MINNGHSKGYFPLERGTRRDDPLSAYLFILCIETLLIQIRENKEVKGIRIGDNAIQPSAYADDADFLTSDVSSLEALFQTCATFQLYSLNLILGSPRLVGLAIEWAQMKGPLIADG